MAHLFPFQSTDGAWKVQYISARRDLAIGYKIEQFNQKPGICFEKIGDLHQVESNWKLIINIDLETLNRRFHDLQKYIDHGQLLNKMQNKELPNSKSNY